MAVNGAMDPRLGEEIHHILLSQGIETPMYKEPSIDRQKDQMEIQGLFGQILNCLNLDPTDDSLMDTPKRVAKMYCQEIFAGLDYNNFPKCTLIENKMGFDEIVCERDLIVRSMCEHHFMPIFGKAHIAYIPSRYVLGLSKFARVLSFFASRPQVQERLTEQLYHSLSAILGTEDVAVVIEAEHFCMKMRGVEASHSETATSKMGGRFRSDTALRSEVLKLMRVGV
jgi:GTP cyclohydrolase I